MNNKYFDFNRLTKFLKREMVITGNSLLIAAGAIFATLLVVTVLTGYFNPSELNDMKGFHLAVFFIAGFIFTSKAFSEMHSPQTGYAYLTLPVSTIEKLTGTWLVTSPIYVLLFSLVSSVIMLAGIAASDGSHYSMAAYFDADFLEAVGVYMVLHTIFFLGACYFRKNNFLKTLLALFLLAIFIAMYAGINFWIFFGSHFEGSNNNIDLQLNENQFSGQIAEVVFWCIVGPFMLLVSYFRLKERQI